MDYLMFITVITKDVTVGIKGSRKRKAQMKKKSAELVS